MPVIEVSNLHKRYGGTVAVDDVSFTVEDGEIFGIIGPNGAGKTNREAARRLFVSDATIKTHLLHIYDKLGVRDRAAAVGEAYKRRLLP
jgi:ATP/maltotriose-dependent transcriptional regulator MalT